MRQDTGTLRVTIREAAARLGVTEAAIRKRIQRGSMGKELGEDGRVYVYLDLSQDTPHPQSQVDRELLVEDLREQVHYLRSVLNDERDARRRADTIIAQLSQANAEQARTIRELEPASKVSNPTDHLEHEEALREGSGLETRTDEQRQRWQERRHGAPRQSPESAAPSTTPTDAGEGAETGAERVSWWRRLFQ